MRTVYVIGWIMLQSIFLILLKLRVCSIEKEPKVVTVTFIFTTMFSPPTYFPNQQSIFLAFYLQPTFATRMLN